MGTVLEVAHPTDMRGRGGVATAVIDIVVDGIALVIVKNCF